jgi:drug/metabolite transporter (DMT)-like permease
MTEGLLYALLGLLGFSALGVFHKLADTLKCRPAPVNALLYGWSLVFITVSIVLRGGELQTPTGVATLAIPFGISASIAILAFQAGIRHGDIATSWLAINLSSGLPTIASILIYHEPVGLQRAIALSLIPVSMALLWKDKRDAERRHHE